MTIPADKVTITVRKNGSLLVTGDVVILDHAGNIIPRINDKPNVALCRCGQSQRQRLDDAPHNTSGFIEPIDPPADPTRPPTVP